MRSKLYPAKNGGRAYVEIRRWGVPLFRYGVHANEAEAHVFTEDLTTEAWGSVQHARTSSITEAENFFLTALAKNGYPTYHVKPLIAQEMNY